MPPFEYGLPDHSELEQEQERQRRAEISDYEAFYLKPGITTFRILPPHPNTRVWYRAIRKHRLVVGGTGYTKICPLTLDEENVCPICDQSALLQSSKDENDVEAARALRATTRYAVNAVILDASGGNFEKGHVYVLELPVRLFRAILAMDLDAASGYEDITGAFTASQGEGLKGVTIRVTRSGQGMKTEYTMLPKGGNRTDLAAELAAIGVDINALKLYDLSSCFKANDETALRAMLAKATLADVRTQPTPVAPMPVVKPVSHNPVPTFEIPAPPTE